MKNKIKFLLPRLIGLTLIVGILSFFMVALFKILALATIGIALFAFIGSRIWKKRLRRHNANSLLENRMQAIVLSHGTQENASPIAVSVQAQKVAIIPIH